MALQASTRTNVTDVYRAAKMLRVTEKADFTGATLTGGTYSGPTITGTWTATGATCADLGTVSAATSITSTAFVGGTGSFSTGSFTGNVTVTKAAAQVILNATSGTPGYKWQTSGTDKWIAYYSGAALIFGIPGTADYFYMADTGKMGVGKASPDYLLDVNGSVGFTPGALVTPVDNGDMTFYAPDNTTFTVAYKGTDGTVRTGTVALS